MYPSKQKKNIKLVAKPKKGFKTPKFQSPIPDSSKEKLQITKKNVMARLKARLTSA